MNYQNNLWAIREVKETAEMCKACTAQWLHTFVFPGFANSCLFTIALHNIERCQSNLEDVQKYLREIDEFGLEIPNVMIPLNSKDAIRISSARS
jgi:hypothetical protein